MKICKKKKELLRVIVVTELTTVQRPKKPAAEGKTFRKILIFRLVNNCARNTEGSV